MAAAVQDNSSLASPAEAALIAQIRKNCEKELAAAPSAAFPEVTGDIAILRFLRGYEGDAVNAEKFFKQMLEWRKEKKVDEVRQAVYALWQKAGGRTEDLMTHTYLPHAEHVLKHYPERFYHKTDRLGNPIKITRQPFINDFPGLMKVITPEQYYQYRLYRGELRSLLLHHLSVQQNRLVKITFIWDLHGMELAYWSLLRSKEVLAYCGDYENTAKDAYPEIAHMIIAVHVPWFLNVLWNAAKGLLPARTLAKIQVHGADYGAKLALLIAPENIPEVMKGVCKCPDGCFPTNWLSEHVGKSAKFNLEYPVNANDTINWEFLCKGYDIAFEAKFVGADLSEQVVKANERYEKDTINRGEFVAPKKGTVKVVFDNSFSWFTGKKVHYNIQVTAFHTHEQEQQQLNADPLLAAAQVEAQMAAAAISPNEQAGGAASAAPRRSPVSGADLLAG